MRLDLQRYQQKWEEDHVFEVDAPSIDEFPLESITADELREKYVQLSGIKRQISDWKERGDFRPGKEFAHGLGYGH